MESEVQGNPSKKRKIEDKNEESSAQMESSIWTPTEQQKLVGRFLLSRKLCCNHCVLRMLNVRNPRLQVCSDEVLSRLNSKSNPQATDGEAIKEVCRACLGILQTAYSPQFREELLLKTKTCDYQFDDFALSFCLPSSTLIRQYSLLYLLHTEFPELTSVPHPQVVEIKEVLKTAIGYFLDTKLSKISTSRSDFTISINFQHAETVNDFQFLTVTQGVKLQTRKTKRLGKKVPTEVSIGALSKVLASLPPAKFKEHGEIPPSAVTTTSTYEILYQHAPIFIGGRYIKLSRDLSQSKWIIHGQRKTAESVEEIIGDPMLPRFRAEEYKFHSAGREDSDVRMLGSGRPFIVELINPHVNKLSPESFAEMEKEINANPKVLRVEQLKKVSKEENIKLKESEETKTKTYRCVVWVSKEVTEKELEFLKDIKDLVIEQKTPIRVLHRRAAATRKKVIHSIGYKVINPHFLTVDLHTQAGTYIKEFIHSDLGRTTPSFGSLLNCEADILQLDVLSIEI